MGWKVNKLKSSHLLFSYIPWECFGQTMNLSADCSVYIYICVCVCVCVLFLNQSFTLSAGAVEYTDGTSAESKDPPQELFLKFNCV